jgi:hypothetical protein
MADKIAVDRDKLLVALRHLEVIVPSLDRIGSAGAEVSEDEHRRMLSDFMSDWEVGRRLSEVRRVLSDLFEYDELEQLFGELRSWRVSRRKPDSNADLG